MNIQSLTSPQTSRPAKRAKFSKSNPFVDIEADITNDGEEEDDEPDAYINDSGMVLQDSNSLT